MELIEEERLGRCRVVLEVDNGFDEFVVYLASDIRVIGDDVSFVNNNNVYTISRSRIRSAVDVESDRIVSSLCRFGQDPLSFTYDAKSFSHVFEQEMRIAANGKVKLSYIAGKFKRPPTRHEPPALGQELPFYQEFLRWYDLIAQTSDTTATLLLLDCDKLGAERVVQRLETFSGSWQVSWRSGQLVTPDQFLPFYS